MRNRKKWWIMSGRRTFILAWMVHLIDLLNAMVTMDSMDGRIPKTLPLRDFVLHMLSSNTYEAPLGGRYHVRNVRAAPLFDEFSTLALMTSTNHLARTSAFSIAHDLQRYFVSSGFQPAKKLLLATFWVVIEDRGR